MIFKFVRLRSIHNLLLTEITMVEDNIYLIINLIDKLKIFQH